MVNNKSGASKGKNEAELDVNTLIEKLKTACHRGYLGMLTQVLGHPNAKNIDSAALGEGLIIACKNNHEELVRQLLEYYYAKDIDSTSLGKGLYSACSQRNATLVALLLKHPKLDASALGEGLEEACSLKEDSEIIAQLLQHSKMNASALVRGIEDACWQESRKVILQLLLHPNFDGAYFTPSLYQAIKTIFNIDDEKIEEKKNTYLKNTSNTMFYELPILHTTLEGGILSSLLPGKETKNVMPPLLQKAIDKGDAKNIASYYGLTLDQLKYIPVSDTPNLASGTLIELVKAGLIRTKPLLIESDQQQAVCNTIQACFTLADELGFDEYDKNNTTTYSEFLTSLIQATARKCLEGWGEIEKKIPKQLYCNLYGTSGVKDMAEDYSKTVFLPYDLQGKQDYDVDQELKNLHPKAITTFFRDVSIDTIYTLSEKWHERVIQSNKKWEPLFSEPHTYESITVIPLINTKALLQEGKGLDHCMKEYINKCLHEHSHIVLVQDKDGKTLSAIEFTIFGCNTEKNGKDIIDIPGQNYYFLAVEQHYGKNNDEPPSKAIKAAEALYKDIRSGVLTVNLYGIEVEQEKRNNGLKNQKELLLSSDDIQDKNTRSNYRNGLKKISKILTYNFDELTGKEKKVGDKFTKVSEEIKSKSESSIKPKKPQDFKKVSEEIKSKSEPSIKLKKIEPLTERFNTTDPNKLGAGKM